MAVTTYSTLWARISRLSGPVLPHGALFYWSMKKTAIPLCQYVTGLLIVPLLHIRYVDILVHISHVLMMGPLPCFSLGYYEIAAVNAAEEL